MTSYTVANLKTKEVRYEYDGLDRRFRRRLDSNGDGDFIDTGDASQRLLYDTNVQDDSFAEVVQMIDETSVGVPDVNKRTHRFFNGPEPDMVFADEVFSATNTPADILWLLQDQQQTVTDVATMSSTSGTATLRNHLEYNAFGDITSLSKRLVAPGGNTYNIINSPGKKLRDGK